MISLKDLKRSLAFTLCSVLILSGVDTTVFAKEDVKPRIESNLGIAVSYDYSKNQIIFTDNFTIPVDFSECDSLDEYIKDNISSVTIFSDSDDLQESIDLSNVKSYLPLGYYSVSNFEDSCISLISKYFNKNNIDDDDTDSVKQAVSDFCSSEREYSVEIEYSNGVKISSELYLSLYDSIPSGASVIGSNTSIDVIIDYWENVDSTAEDVYYHAYVGTSRGYVLSVPTSKTAEINNLDNNAIKIVKEGDTYNTYYVDINSDNDISIPLNDFSSGVDISRVSFNDNIIFDTNSSIRLNGNESNLDVTGKNDNFYLLEGTSLLDIWGSNSMIITPYNLDDVVSVIKNFLKDNKVTLVYEQGEVNLDFRCRFFL